MDIHVGGGDTHAYPLVFAQPQSRDESIRCAELEEQIWQTVTLVRKHNPVPGEMMEGKGTHALRSRKSLPKAKLEAQFLC